MHGIKSDIVYSCDCPTICDACKHQMTRTELMSVDIVNQICRELKAIQKPLVYRIISFIKQHPLWSIALSAFSALLIGIVSSIIASLILKI